MLAGQGVREVTLLGQNVNSYADSTVVLEAQAAAGPGRSAAGGAAGLLLGSCAAAWLHLLLRVRRSHSICLGAVGARGQCAQAPGVLAARASVQYTSEQPHTQRATTLLTTIQTCSC